MDILFIDQMYFNTCDQKNNDTVVTESIRHNTFVQET